MGMERTLLPFSVSNKQTTAKSSNKKKFCTVVAMITYTVGETYTILATLFIAMRIT